MWTHPFAAFVAPARARPQLWRLLLGLVLTLGVYAATIAAVLVGAVLVLRPEGVETWLAGMATGETPSGVLVLLATFLGMALGPVAAAALLHRRAPVTLFGPGLARDFAVGFGVAAAAILAMGLFSPAPSGVMRNAPADLYAALLVPALLGLLVQTGAEEVLFRGYLQTQLAARFDHPAIWMGLPSVLFGLLHYTPATAGANAPWLVLAATVFGLAAADLVRVTGNIGAGWGLHFANNCAAVLVVALDGSLSGLAFWRTEAGVESISPVLLMQDVLTTVIVWALIRLWLARRAPSGT